MPRKSRDSASASRASNPLDPIAEIPVPDPVAEVPARTPAPELELEPGAIVEFPEGMAITAQGPAAVGEIVLCRMGGGRPLFPALVIAEDGSLRDLLVFHPPTFGGSATSTFMGRMPFMLSPDQSRGWKPKPMGVSWVLGTDEGTAAA